LTRLEDRFKAANGAAVFTQISEVRNLGGLSGMMRQICRFYEFSPPSQEKLQDEEKMPVWKLTGTLKSVYHKELLARFGGLDGRGQYPADFPSDIEILLGQPNDFPYAIRYYRRSSEKSDRKDLLFQEEFRKVILDGMPLSRAKFALLTPPQNVFMQDDTESVLKTLGL
jgi:hypothetical protein